VYKTEVGGDQTKRHHNLWEIAIERPCLEHGQLTLHIKELRLDLEGHWVATGCSRAEE
jgi:hypothetical protein